MLELMIFNFIDIRKHIVYDIVFCRFADHFVFVCKVLRSEYLIISRLFNQKAAAFLTLTVSCFMFVSPFLNEFKYAGGSHAASDAHRHHAELLVSPFHFMNE